jgi:hypothetical protein
MQKANWLIGLLTLLNFYQNAVIGPVGKAVPLSRPERINKPAVPLVSALPPAIRQPNRR